MAANKLKHPKPLFVRVTGQQHKQIRKAADRAGMSMSSWLRMVALAVAERGSIEVVVSSEA